MASKSIPRDPIAAVNYRDPYPYYTNLNTTEDLYWEPALGMWISASARAVQETLNSRLCAVRPTLEPVPAALQATKSGEVFRRLVRMNDGAFHESTRTGLVRALGTLDLCALDKESRSTAKSIVNGPANSLPFAFALPAIVLSSQLGVPEHSRASVAGWIRDFVYCLSPLSDADQLRRANEAAEHLMETFSALLAETDRQSEPTLLSELQLAIVDVQAGDDDDITANAIGILSQTCEATAGLIGNTLLVLSRRPDIVLEIQQDAIELHALIDEVLRLDPPIQNTRRFVIEDGEICGQQVEAGEAILVLLAAANRDSRLFDQPETLDLNRQHSGHFAFGAGHHRCPGSAPACVIAAAGIETLLDNGVLDDIPEQDVDYLVSVNARIPRIPNVTVTERREAGGENP
jgi:cytochrome P450